MEALALERSDRSGECFCGEGQVDASNTQGWRPAICAQPLVREGKGCPTHIAEITTKDNLNASLWRLACLLVNVALDAVDSLPPSRPSCESSSLCQKRAPEMKRASLFNTCAQAAWNFELLAPLSGGVRHGPACWQRHLAKHPFQDMARTGFPIITKEEILPPAPRPRLVPPPKEDPGQFLDVLPEPERPPRSTGTNHPDCPAKNSDQRVQQMQPFTM
jgi:hypothetical protein